MNQDTKAAEHNWGIVCKYGTNEKEVSKAAFAAGYDINTALGAISDAIMSTKWAKRKIAHGKGGQGSSVRGGTNEEIQECKEAILEWLRNHYM